MVSLPEALMCSYLVIQYCGMYRVQGEGDNPRSWIHPMSKLVGRLGLSMSSVVLSPMVWTVPIQV